eukprot:10022931-Lingulodinium_polyedra.AAC.1
MYCSRRRSKRSRASGSLSSLGSQGGPPQLCAPEPPVAQESCTPVGAWSMPSKRLSKLCHGLMAEHALS